MKDLFIEVGHYVVNVEKISSFTVFKNKDRVELHFYVCGDSYTYKQIFENKTQMETWLENNFSYEARRSSFYSRLTRALLSIDWNELEKNKKSVY